MPLLPVPPRQERPELIDSADPSGKDFAASFDDIARVNRFLGGTRAVLRSLIPLAATLPPAPRPVTILDLATGSADIPRAIARAARRGRFGGRPVRIVAADNHPKVLVVARRLSQAYPEITVEKADVFSLPYPDRAFDFVLCSLAFHHFGPEGCVRVLREMERIASAGFLVNDLVRDRLACGLIWALTRLLGANRLTRHDAPLSVLRAYTVPEYVRMVRAAGIPSCEVRPFPFYRAVIVRHRLESSSP
jgi:hypothetical protein